MKLLSHGPEPCASANSAIPAYRRNPNAYIVCDFSVSVNRFLIKTALFSVFVYLKNTHRDNSGNSAEHKSANKKNQCKHNISPFGFFVSLHRFSFVMQKLFYVNNAANAKIFRISAKNFYRL